MKERGINLVIMDSKNKNTAVLLAVGEKFTDLLIENIQKFNSDLWDFHILTDQPERLKEMIIFEKYNIYKYHNAIFSYFDKLLFTLRILNEKKVNVLCLDVDKLHLLSEDFKTINHDYEEFRFYSENRWAPYFSRLKNNGSWNIVYKYFKYVDLDVNNIRNFWEEILYFPYQVFKNYQFLVDIETLKPIFEYRTIVDGWSRPCLGEGEGIALGYLIEKYRLECKKFDCQVFINDNPFDGGENLSLY